jgi:hypothetical protein
VTGLSRRQASAAKAVQAMTAAAMRRNRFIPRNLDRPEPPSTVSALKSTSADVSWSHGRSGSVEPRRRTAPWGWRVIPAPNRKHRWSDRGGGMVAE